MREVFAEHRPTVVFHAAAYKHVGLMEANPVEAVRNNAIATRVVARVAGADRRRGVRPRLDRQGRRARDGHGRVEGAGRVGGRGRGRSGSRRRATPRVRFGNVLGSSGSVVPIFRRQIARGGPVTVTDERMTRYFMTIPEAVQLIIRAGSLGEGGEVFVLDMGEPVNDPASSRSAMIELSGPRARARTSRSRSSAGGRARSCTRSCSTPYERPQPTPAEKILRAERDAARRREPWTRCSTRSACSSWRATPRRWRRRSPSSRRRRGRPPRRTRPRRPETTI